MDWGLVATEQRSHKRESGCEMEVQGFGEGVCVSAGGVVFFCRGSKWVGAAPSCLPLIPE